MDDIEAKLKDFIANIEDTLTQAGAMQASLDLSIPAELRMATLLERQVIFAELQQARETTNQVINSIATYKNAIAQERATKEYEAARRSSETLARSQSALSKAIDRARDSMERGASLDSISRLVNLIVEVMTEQGFLVILLARTSQDDVIRQKARQIEQGIEQIDREGKQQQLKIYYSNRARLQLEAAKFGGQVPLNLQNELDDTEQQIQKLKEELGL